MLASVGADELSDTGVDAAEFDGVAIEVNTWGLNLAQQLEKERLCISDKNLKVLADALLVDAVSSHHDLLALVRTQSVMSGIEVDDIATASFDGLSNDQASTLYAAFLLAILRIHHYEVFERQLLVL